jgi:hypothetical protein
MFAVVVVIGAAVAIVDVIVNGLKYVKSLLFILIIIDGIFEKHIKRIQQHIVMLALVITLALFIFYGSLFSCHNVVIGK